MNYNQARITRRTPLSDLIANRIATKDSMLGGIGAAMSDKFKSNVVGLKERVDPLNIIKKTTGSNLAATLFGKMTGRSPTDISYFTNRAVPMSNTQPKTLTPIQTPGDSVNLAPVLQSIYTLLSDTLENERKRFEEEKLFEEERRNEEERRHQNFLKVLKDYTGAKLLPVVDQPKDQDRLLSKIFDILKGVSSFLYGGLKLLLAKTLKPLLSWFGKKMLSLVGKGLGLLKDGLFSALSWLKNLNWASIGTNIMKALPRLLPLAGPVGLAIIGMTAMWTGRKEWEKKKEEIDKDPWNPKYKDDLYAMTVRGEAKTLGEAGAENRRKSLKKYSRAQVQELVSDKSRTDDELKYYFGEPRVVLERWLQENPQPSAVFDPNSLKFQQKAEKSKATPLPAGVTPSQAGAGRGITVPDMQQMPSSVVPIPEMKFGDFPELMNENKNLKLEEEFRQIQPVEQTPTVSVTNNTDSVEGKPSNMPAKIRDDTPILRSVFDNYRLSY